MKRLSLLMIILCVSLPSLCEARPQDSLLKLSKSQSLAETNQLPPIVLNKKEEDELIGFIIKEYRKQGIRVTRQQAAITAGHMAKNLAETPQLAEALAGSVKKRAKPKLPVKQEIKKSKLKEDDNSLSYDLHFLDIKF